MKISGTLGNVNYNKGGLGCVVFATFPTILETGLNKIMTKVMVVCCVVVSLSVAPKQFVDVNTSVINVVTY